MSDLFSQLIRVEEKSGMQYKEEESYDRKYDLDEGSKSMLLKQHMFVEQQQRDILVSCSSITVVSNLLDGKLLICMQLVTLLSKSFRS